MHVFTIVLVLYLLLSNATALAADIVARRAFKPPLYPARPRRGIGVLGRVGQMVRGG